MRKNKINFYHVWGATFYITIWMYLPLIIPGPPPPGGPPPGNGALIPLPMAPGGSPPRGAP